MAELKALYGAMFQDMLTNYTHWGWVDVDSIFGNFEPLIDALEDFDVVSFPDGVRSWISCDVFP